MKKLAMLAAAFAVVCLALFAIPDAAFAQHGYEPPDAPIVQVQDPMPALGEEYATPTQYNPPSENGGIIGVIGQLAVPFLAAAFTAFFAMITAALNKYLNKKASAETSQTINTWTKRAVQAAANFVEGAAPNLPVTYRIGAEWVERALEQCLALWPETVAANGGEDAQRRRLWAEIQLLPGESVPGMSPVQLNPVRAKTPAPTTPAPTASPPVGP